MLNIDEIMNGVVIDHITAGTGLSLYHPAAERAQPEKRQKGYY